MLKISWSSMVVRSRQNFCTAFVSDVKHFDNIPGPKGPLNLGTITRYLPLIGKQFCIEFDQIDK